MAKLHHQPRKLRKRTRKAPGTPPGTLQWFGGAAERPGTLRLISLGGQGVQDALYTSAAEMLPQLDAERQHLIILSGLEQVSTLTALGERFGLSPLLLEDVLNVEHRTKLEVQEAMSFLILKAYLREAPNPANGSSPIIGNHLALFLLPPNVLLLMTENEQFLLPALRHRLEVMQARLHRVKVDYLCYSILDLVVDHYLDCVHWLEEEIERLEDALWNEHTEGVLFQFQSLKRDLIMLRKGAWPLKDLLHFLYLPEARHFEETTKPYLRDVHDHVLHILEVIDLLKEHLGELREVYHSNLGERTNRVMKFLTLISTIFLPLNFLAGVYGMNFGWMPLLDHPLGFWLIGAAMVGTALGMLWVFRRRGWW